MKKRYTKPLMQAQVEVALEEDFLGSVNPGVVTTAQQVDTYDFGSGDFNFTWEEAN